MINGLCPPDGEQAGQKLFSIPEISVCKSPLPELGTYLSIDECPLSVLVAGHER
jgi:hypothetical protein